MKLRRFNLQGKQHGYNDNYKTGQDDRFEIVRRPYSDYRRDYMPRPHYNERQYDDRHLDDGSDRYSSSNHWVSQNKFSTFHD